MQYFVTGTILLNRNLFQISEHGRFVEFRLTDLNYGWLCVRGQTFCTILFYDPTKEQYNKIVGLGKHNG